MENIELFATIYDFLEMLIAKYGVFGIAAAMFAESAGIPFASAIVLLTAGTMILRGSVSFWSILFASTIGITLGSIISYILGMIGSIVGNQVKTNIFNDPLLSTGEKKHIRSRLIKLWKQYGNFSIFMAQLWGFSRTFISFPAGAMKMNFYLFIGYTFLGGTIFSLLAICTSIVLTRTMNLVIFYLKMIAGFSLWLLLIPAMLLLAILIYHFYYKRKK
jgi:membrane protein DedA with SNARE-associated domain